MLSNELNAQVFVHPGLGLNQADLNKMRTDVKGRIQPKIAGWDKMMSYTSTWASLYYVTNETPIVYADGATSNGFTNDITAAYTQALIWAVNKNQVNADKAIAILNAWSNTLVAIESKSGEYARQNVLVAGWAAQPLCEAAEILRYSNAGWSVSDITKFESMMKTIFYPLIANHSKENGNWEASQLQSMMAIGVFCNDRAKYDEGVSYYRGSGRGAVGTYIYESGECQETCRDFIHTQMGIGELVDAAEIAWNQGLDLYSDLPDPVTGMPRLAEGLEYLAKMTNGITLPSNCNVASENGQTLQPMWEKAWNHYGNTKGRTDMTFTQTNALRSRPSGKTQTNNFDWQTLTHANDVLAVGCGNVIPWTSYSFPVEKGNFITEFDIIPGGNNMNGAVGLSNGAATAYTNLGCIVLFDVDGTIKARNGVLYAAANVLPYVQTTTYHVKMDVNVSTRNYDVFVTPQGLPTVQIAFNYSFRSEQASVSQLNNLSLKTETCGLTLKNYLSTPTFEANNSLVIYPNPLAQNQEFTIKLNSEVQKTTIEIYDINARLIQELKAENLSNYKVKLKTDLKSGIYIVKVSDGKKAFQQKLIVE